MCIEKIITTKELKTLCKGFKGDIPSPTGRIVIKIHTNGLWSLLYEVGDVWEIAIPSYGEKTFDFQLGGIA